MLWAYNLVIHVQSLVEVLVNVFSMLDIPFWDDLKANEKSHYRKDNRPYQDVYTKEQIKNWINVQQWNRNTLVQVSLMKNRLQTLIYYSIEIF